MMTEQDMGSGEGVCTVTIHVAIKALLPLTDASLMLAHRPR